MQHTSWHHCTISVSNQCVMLQCNSLGFIGVGPNCICIVAGAWKPADCSCDVCGACQLALSVYKCHSQYRRRAFIVTTTLLLWLWCICPEACVLVRRKSVRSPATGTRFDWRQSTWPSCVGHTVPGTQWRPGSLPLHCQGNCGGPIPYLRSPHSPKDTEAARFLTSTQSQGHCDGLGT